MSLAFILLSVWLLVVVVALLLCVTARKGDEQLALAEVQPVIDEPISSTSTSPRQLA